VTELYVNGERIEASFEGERDAASAIASAAKWLHAQGMALVAAKVDGKAMDSESAATALGGISRIDIEAISERNLATEALGSIKGFLGALSEALGTGDRAALKIGLENVGTVVESYRAVTGEEGPFALLSGGQDDAALAKALSGCEAVVEERLRELESPREELSRAANLLERTFDGMSELSLLLQTGKESEAMSSLLLFSEIAGKVARLISTLSRDGQTRDLRIGGLEVGEFYKGLNAELRNLVEAFERRDSVLLGDLAEYEVVPRMRDLAEATKALAGA
jgi:hypothetical protein